MEVAEQSTPLLTTDQMAEWYSVGRDAIDLAVKLAATAYDIRQVVSSVYTNDSFGIFLNQNADHLLIDIPPGGDIRDYTLLKSALDKVMPQLGIWADAAIRDNSLASPVNCGYVKVAYSPVIRQTGEMLGFFPHADAVGNLSGNPSPIRSMLTSGLIGAGLGYGAGALAEGGMPRNWKKGRLRNTLAAVGGMLGAAPGAIWGAANKGIGKPFNDNSLLNHAPNADPEMSPPEVGNNWKAASALVAAQFPVSDEELIKTAFDEIAMPWDQASRPGPTPMDVNVDVMGRTLWETGASPQLAGATMGALAAAQQMPGGREDEPGWVTPAQMASLAAHMGAGYVSGAIVGSTLGLLTGMSDSAQNTLKRTGMYLGVVQSVLPKLFGQ